MRSVRDDAFSISGFGLEARVAVADVDSFAGTSDVSDFITIGAFCQM